jgi:hypothetical protein
MDSPGAAPPESDAGLPEGAVRSPDINRCLFL